MKKSVRVHKLAMGIAIIAMAFTYSCKEEEKATFTPEQPVQNTPAQEISDSEASNSNDEAPAKTVMVNPAHGLPGHTCALPVGAPLNSDIKMEANTPTPSTTISPLRVDQTPKVNPPHGEPGHTCDLPVGAPLP